MVNNYLTGETKPDVVVIIADASNLNSNLLLLSQVYNLQIPVILVLQSNGPDH
ncbi:MAG: hypothetical protein GDA51_00185 [Ekhidna sp.]|nr:hypothetical protein [Ekhidna sp.]